MGWHRELLIGFDLDTTGTDPREARIVTGAVTEVGAGEPTGRREWPADPGVPVPEDAAAVHGVGDGRATAEGSPTDRTADAAGVLTARWRTGVPVVASDTAFCPRAPVASRASRTAPVCRVPARAGSGAA